LRPNSPHLAASSPAGHIAQPVHPVRCAPARRLRVGPQLGRRL